MKPSPDWASLEQLTPGVAGTSHTLERMAEFVRRDKDDLGLRAFALRIVRGVPGHQFGSEIQALFEYVRDWIRYRRAPIGTQLVSDARRTLQLGSGDCAQKSVLLATLLATLGHRSQFVVFSYDGDDYQHVALEAAYRGEWIPLDPTNEAAPAGWQPAAVMVDRYPIF